ncbi:hypothetical protein GO685_00640 [Wolbachia endosymbiont of Madathamugadia hiepei]|uniref:hypothetical protein n=1 Tax=Wolbachia endosymbiont of Madathamugadia hiepei TaxID=1241303 RepID=UPI00158E10C1|nr:hypothetical protein [Wolbachia endosymbiont of Madathamugadia hiepei]NUX01036.1 hypothetical protein [Wolbachia endosymbiont of Madathamugadia hiepei]
MTKKSRNASQREEMTPFEGKATVTIFSSLEDIEKGRKIYFSLKGEGLTIDTFSISDNSHRLCFVVGITKKIPTPEECCRLMINNIISDLKSGRTKSKTEYDFREFDERYLKDLKGLFSHKTTTTSLQEEPTTERVEHETQATGVTDSTTTELFQSEKPTTEKVEYEVQEDSKYVAAALKQQKFDFASTNATGNTSGVIREMIESNTSLCEQNFREAI